jgi:hypothetical protein
MAFSINAVHTDPAAASAPVSQPAAEPQTSKKSTQLQASTTAPPDTVQISNAGRAAAQEATETPSQTAQEARSGDQQAQRLLAKEAAQQKH